jgi:hypothetical protein
MLLINPIIINRYRKKIHLPLKASLMIFIDKEKRYNFIIPILSIMVFSQGLSCHNKNAIIFDTIDG